MKISHKLVGSFVGISLLTGVVGAVAVVESQKIAETLAIKEAENVAQTMAIVLAPDGDEHGASSSLKHKDDLRADVSRMHELQKRDVVVVDRQKLILADAIPENVGTIFDHDQGNEIQQTMQDSNIRTFLEKSVDYPQGIKQIVVPLKSAQSKIVGAVILEWSGLYDDTIAQARPTLIVIGMTSLGCLVLAIFLGLTISRSIAKPLQAVTAVALRVTQESNFDLQAPVTTYDETGSLATALNQLIQRVKALLNEKEERTEELQQTLNQLRNAQLQLVQTEKMSSLGQLVAGVAHEINNPVNFIHGNITHVDRYTQDLLTVVQAYQTHYPHPPAALQATLQAVELDFLYEDLAKLMQSMKVGTDRIRQIVLSLRNFSRLDEAEFKAVDLHEGLDSTLLILQHRLKAKPDSLAITLIKDYGQLPLVECYPSQLNQVFMNLVANAIDVLEDSGHQRTQEHQPAQPSMIWLSTQVTAEKQVKITIADNGSGMSEAVRSRIFDPFFTTKPIGRGTGLGLSISYQIVTEKHHGMMWCDSTPGEGTKFVLEIPLRQPESTST